MSILLNEIVPNFKADTSQGPIDFHQYISGSWAILFSHPADFTPVCTTELARAAQLEKEFSQRNVKLLALSCDSAESHKLWIPDIEAQSKCSVTYPIIDDLDRSIAKTYGMLPAQPKGEGLPLTVRAVFIIGSDTKLKATLCYPASTGRNFDEILRVIDSLQLAVSHKVATPVDWTKGKDCVLLPSVKDEDTPKLFPKGFKVADLPSGKPYLRMTPQPDI